MRSLSTMVLAADIFTSSVLALAFAYSTCGICKVGCVKTYCGVAGLALINWDWEGSMTRSIVIVFDEFCLGDMYVVVLWLFGSTF